MIARRISLKVAASTDARSVESKTIYSGSIGLAGQSLLPPTRGRWRAFSITAFHDYCRFPDEKCFTALPLEGFSLCPILHSIPPINRWAIIGCPKGTRRKNRRSRRNESQRFERAFTHRDNISKSLGQRPVNHRRGGGGVGSLLNAARR